MREDRLHHRLARFRRRIKYGRAAIPGRNESGDADLYANQRGRERPHPLDRQKLDRRPAVHDPLQRKRRNNLFPAGKDKQRDTKGRDRKNIEPKK